MLIIPERIKGKTCIHRQRWECGGRVIQYCRIRNSNRTFNGLLKIKVTNPACVYYRDLKWEDEPIKVDVIFKPKTL